VLDSGRYLVNKFEKMKQLFLLLIAVVATASIVRAGDVKIDAVLATGLEDEPTTTFADDTPKLFALFKTDGLQDGDKVRGVWIAEDVGDAAPKGTKIDEKTLNAEGDTDDGVFSLSKPPKGWPAGKYRLEIYANDELATKVKFTIHGAGKAKKVADESAEVPEESDLKSMTTTSLLAFGEAVKKKDFSSFYEDVASVWQEQTTAKKLQEAFKDFYGKNIDLPSAIKGVEPIFNRPPAVGSNGVLLIQGYYPTKPNRVVFQLKYLKEEDAWKLVGVDVNLKE
jgi:hypothetical protein